MGDHDLWGGAGADLGQVLSEGHIPHPVQPVLDLPQAADPGGQLIGSGFVRIQVDDRVDDLGAPSPLLPGARGGAGAASDLDGLAGARHVGDPLGNRDERPCPGHDRAHRRGQHETRPCRTPRRSRGSTTPPNTSRRPGASTTGSGSAAPPTRSATAAIDKDADAGTALLTVIKLGVRGARSPPGPSLRPYLRPRVAAAQRLLARLCRPPEAGRSRRWESTAAVAAGSGRSAPNGT
jgi:hypothetical protein